jgi:hypothetical protein
LQILVLDAGDAFGQQPLCLEKVLQGNVVLQLWKMHNPHIRSCQRIQNVSNDLGWGHMLDIILNVGEIHQLQALNPIPRMQLLLRLMKPTDHQHINLVVLADVILALLDSLYKLLLELLVAFFGREGVLWEWELHECLVEENAGEKVELLFADDGGLVVLVQDERDPLWGRVAALWLEDVLSEESQRLGGVSEGDIKFLS